MYNVGRSSNWLFTSYWPNILRIFYFMQSQSIVRNLQIDSVSTVFSGRSRWRDVSRDTDLWPLMYRRSVCGRWRCVCSRHIYIDQHRREPASQTTPSDCAHRNICIPGPTTKSLSTDSPTCTFLDVIFWDVKHLKLTYNIWRIRIRPSDKIEFLLPFWN